MATLTGGPINSINFDFQFIDNWLSGAISDQSPTQFVATPAANFRLEYTGVGLTYDANGNPVSGTITGIRVLQFATLWMQFEDIEISMQAYRGFVGSNDAEGLFAAAFSGDDIMSRATNNTHPDQLNGYAGNDSIDGNAGDDTLLGGTGNDSLVGALGADKLFGGAGNDSYFVDDSEDIVDETGGSGIDTVVVRGSAFSLQANGLGAIENIEIVGLGLSFVSGNDIANRITGNGEQNNVFGFGGNDTIDGGGGNDTLNGGIDNDRLNGGDGTDSLFGGLGNDTLAGGAGNDFYSIDDGDALIESLGGTHGGIDTVRYNGAKGSHVLGTNIENLVLGSGSTGTGNELDNTLTGNLSANHLLGLAGDDTLIGDAGNDTLAGGKGADLMQGGDGLDTYIVDSVFDAIDETGAKTGRDTVESSVSYSLAIADGQVTGDVEILILKGTASINGTGNALNNLLQGTSGKNRLTGLDGNDTLDGGIGADTMEGGSGNDTYVINSTADVFVETGSDPLDMVVVNMSVDLNAARFQNIESAALTGTAALNAFGTNAGNQLFGNAGANKLFGFGSLDELRGGAGNDTLDGGEGDDFMFGGAGNDTYIVDSTDDVVLGEAAGKAGGFDTVHSSAKKYTMSEGVETLILEFGAANGTGNNLNNLLSGNELENVLDGKGGNDTLTGGDGNDTLIANDTGKDLLIGGIGSDRYVIGDGDKIMESLPGEGGGDDTVVYAGSGGFTLGKHLEMLELAAGSAAVEGIGNEINNIITGNQNNNRLRGMGGDDTLIATDGSNTLDGGAGADSMFGAFDFDLYIVDNALDVIDESLGGVIQDAVHSSISFDLTENGTTIIGRLEDLVLTGSKAINGTGNFLRNTITGNAAANILNGGDGVDTLSGGGGNDSLIGGADGSGDILDGGLGADTMEGGEGNDFYTVDNTKDVVIEHDGLAGGLDFVTASVSYTLGGEIENLVLIGKALVGNGNFLDNKIDGNQASNMLRGFEGNDFLVAITGNDTLDGGIGNDTMFGGTGNDTYLVDTFDDVVDEITGDGIDSVIATSTYSLSNAAAAGIENLTLAAGARDIDGRGNDQDNRITGNEGRNILAGFSGDDTIAGGSHDDQLLGGEGNDSLSGGNHIDRLIGGAGDDTLSGGLGRDFYEYESILDGHDLIVGFDGNPAGDQDFLDMDALLDSLGVATADRAARIRATDRGAAVDIRVDTDGDGTFDLFAATLQTADAITVGVDVVVGTL